MDAFSGTGFLALVTPSAGFALGGSDAPSDASGAGDGAGVVGEVGEGEEGDWLAWCLDVGGVVGRLGGGGGVGAFCERWRGACAESEEGHAGAQNRQGRGKRREG